MWVDGAEAAPPLRWRKNLGLCILLWSSPARRVSRDVALTMLWGHRNEHEARHSLNEALRVIRKHLGATVIDSAGDILQWIAPVSLDTDAFVANEPEDLMGAALLIRGTWCEGFTIPDAPDFEQWLDDERRRWRHRLVGVLASATDRAGDLGQLHLAREWSSVAHRLDPLSEVAARARIRCLALSGDRTGALAEADAFSARVLEVDEAVPAEADAVEVEDVGPPAVPARQVPRRTCCEAAALRRSPEHRSRCRAR
jgi:DNA-binding SARP family transcriptional activator